MDLANSLREQGDLDGSEAFIDGMFSAATEGGAEIGHNERGKSVRIMGNSDRHGLPLSVSTHCGEPSRIDAGAVGL